jgi:type II secretory pathway pseudopilin PulG
MYNQNLQSRAGFSMIELLMVTGVVAFLLGVWFPALQRIRGAADHTKTMNNLSQCVRAAHTAHDNNKKFPPYFGLYGAKGVVDTTGYSFHTHLLPYVDQVNVYRAQTLDTKAIVPVYLSPLDPTLTDKGAGVANYPVNLRLFYTKGGLGELATGDALIYPRLAGMPDGTSHTLMFATKYHHCGKNGGSHWADSNALDSPFAATFGGRLELWQKAPGQAACDPTAGTAVSFTPDRIQVAICDGSVRSLSVRLSQPTWQAAHTPGGGDVLGADWGD